MHCGCKLKMQSLCSPSHCCIHKQHWDIPRPMWSATLTVMYLLLPHRLEPWCSHWKQPLLLQHQVSSPWCWRTSPVVHNVRRESQKDESFTLADSCYPIITDTIFEWIMYIIQLPPESICAPVWCGLQLRHIIMCSQETSQEAEKDSVPPTLNSYPQFIASNKHI